MPSTVLGLLYILIAHRSSVDELPPDMIGDNVSDKQIDEILDSFFVEWRGREHEVDKFHAIMISICNDRIRQIAVPFSETMDLITDPLMAEFEEQYQAANRKQDI